MPQPAPPAPARAAGGALPLACRYGVLALLQEDLENIVQSYADKLGHDGKLSGADGTMTPVLEESF